MSERYKESLQVDRETSTRYYNASVLRKSEQHRQLERMLRARGLQPSNVADIACGGGGSSFHLAELYPDAHYTLVDLNEEAVGIARETMRGRNATCLVGDIYHLDLPDKSFDLVVCWQTLSWIERPDAALRELVRICKSGALLYASALFNTQHDVDIHSQVFDHTRPSSAQGLHYVYNTYSLRSVKQWLDGLVSELQVHEFEIPIDLTYEGRGLGTRTVRLETGQRLQLSAGMLLNWGILELRK
jgi:ubiquinone/menaquinone biosynthesis C-methylase UbiE